ncbi:hypothetical protein HN873_035612 [Arachis hypogaea]
MCISPPPSSSPPSSSSSPSPAFTLPTFPEGFAFAHRTTCKAPYHLRVHGAADKKCSTCRCFDSTWLPVAQYFLFLLVIASLAYLDYLIDGYQQYWLHLVWGFDSEPSFYYICGALLFLYCLAYQDASLLVAVILDSSYFLCLYRYMEYFKLVFDRGLIRVYHDWCEQKIQLLAKEVTRTRLDDENLILEK